MEQKSEQEFEIVTERKCACGCGEHPKASNQYINGHQNRGRKWSKEIKIKMSEIALERSLRK